MTDREPFNAAQCEGVVKGTCVMLLDNKIVYAGPIKGCPSVEGQTVLLHADDFELLRSHVEKRRH